MAGSWNHFVKDGKFDGLGTVEENTGDVWEALEECYGMVWYLANRLQDSENHRFGAVDPLAVYVEEARENYVEGVGVSPGYTKKAVKETPPYFPTYPIVKKKADR